MEAKERSLASTASTKLLGMHAHVEYLGCAHACGAWHRVSAELRLLHSELPITDLLSLFPISTLALRPQLGQMRFD